MANSDTSPSVPRETKLPIKGSFRVWAEIKGQLDAFGDQHFSADRSMLEHWENLLASEMADDLKAQLPEVLKIIKALDDAKFVSKKLLDTQITI